MGTANAPNSSRGNTVVESALDVEGLVGPMRDRRLDHHRLLGGWVAGTQVKSIIEGSSMRLALGAIWSILIHGISEVRATSAMNRMKSDRNARRRDQPLSGRVRIRSVAGCIGVFACGSLGEQLAPVLDLVATVGGDREGEVVQHFDEPCGDARCGPFGFDELVDRCGDVVLPGRWVKQ